jgi:hypothetical protein
VRQRLRAAFQIRAGIAQHHHTPCGVRECELRATSSRYTVHHRQSSVLSGRVQRLRFENPPSTTCKPEPSSKSIGYPREIFFYFARQSISGGRLDGSEPPIPATI